MKVKSFVVFTLVLLNLSGVYLVHGQNLQLRNRIGQMYSKDSLSVLMQSYRKKVPFQSRASALDLKNSKPHWVEVDELGNYIYYKTYNQRAAEVTRVSELNSGKLSQIALEGQGMIIGAWDAGIPKFDHLDLEGRIQIKDESSYQQITKHATHVAGTLISNGQNAPRGRGLACQANLWVGNWDEDLNKMTQAAAQGLLVSNHSYGIAPEDLPQYYYGSYTRSSQGVDAITYQMKYYQPVVAAGNDRRDFSKYNPSKSGADLLTGMGTAKNAVVVAAVETRRDEKGRWTCFMSDFSNWGPTDDFRIKPDIAAPGVGLFSTLDTANTAYGIMSGTSMATPVVSAVLTLWQQYYGQLEPLGDLAVLRSASLRGLVAHTAEPISGQWGPDHKTGWGLINAVGGVTFLKDAAARNRTYLVESVLIHGEAYEWVGYSDGKEKITATLSWTDKEGVSKLGREDDSKPDLVNNLDLLLIQGEQKHYPWRLKSEFGNPVAEQGVNNVDNVEKIEILTPEQGAYSVRLSHKGKLQQGSQEFSLLTTGLHNLRKQPIPRSEKPRIWPNPTSDFLSVNMGKWQIDNGDLEIFDSSGKKVWEIRDIRSDSDKIFQIDISMLKSGVYFIIFKNNEVKYVFDVIKL